MIPTAVTIADLRSAVAAAKAAGLSVGFVPTMGALHEGHASLVRLARQECGYVVVSVFVNPTQFGPNEDLARYPRTVDADLALCEREGADLVFTPTPEEVYPPGFATYVEVHNLQDTLEGTVRPGHFRGVATVVLKLFNMVRPDRVYFGQKDAQQVAVIKAMVRDLDVPVELRVGPTVREPDGLALSSRNRYLDPEQRRHAAVLFQALSAARAAIVAGERDAGRLRRLMAERLCATPGAVLDYAEVVHPDDFRPLDRLTGPALAAVAVRFGATRLIDNLPLELPPRHSALDTQH
jgi:pantoate--beta-alanine ligase